MNHPKRQEYILRDGELVFARTGASVGKSYLYDSRDGELVYAGFLINIAPDARVLNPKYLSAFAQTKEYWDWVERTSMRSGQPGINGREYAGLPIPVVDIQEQEAIACVATDADGLIAALEDLIAKKRAIKQGLMQELLTGRTRLPGFSQQWEDTTAGSIGFFKGGSGFPVRFQGRQAGKYPFFKVSDMNNPGNELFMKEANNYIDERHREKMSAACVPENAIVFAKVGAAVFLERKRILAQPSCIDNNMAAFVIDPVKADVRFLHYLLSMFRMSSLVATTALPSLNGSQLRSIPMRLPTDLSEQRAIAEVLEDVDQELGILGFRLAKARNIKQGMMQNLLTGRTRLPVEVVS